MPDRPYVSWISRRRKKLEEAFHSIYGTRWTPADWHDFTEAEFAKFQRGEISYHKYLTRSVSQPGQPAPSKPL